MSQVEDSFSSVSTTTKSLPIIAELLVKMQNIVILSQKSNVSDSIPDEDDMWWDQSDVCQDSFLNPPCCACTCNGREKEKHQYLDVTPIGRFNCYMLS